MQTITLKLWTEFNKIIFFERGENMISVIVPIFRVEKFLEACIASIQNQTYQALEIILIDDGSDDNCASICDRYAKEDARIRVIHKENGGLSEARNTGLEMATGEYIAFVDGDDVILPQMYENMVTFLEKNPDINISMCEFQKVEELKDTMDFNVQEGKFCVLDHDTILKEMFSEKYEKYVVVWNKLYRRTIWKKMRFPIGKLHEDEFVSYQYLYEQCYIASISVPFYCYRKRQGSIMQNCEAKSYLDCTEALQQKLEFFREKKEKEYTMCVNRSLNSIVYYYEQARKNGDKKIATQLYKIFLKEWNRAKKVVMAELPKERYYYFSCFAISHLCCKLCMPFYWKKISFVRKTKNKIRRNYYFWKGKRQAKEKQNPNILSIEETLKTIIKQKCSVSRYGDGEYKWMAGIPQTSFQGYSEEMQQRLLEICKSNAANHLVCLSDGFGKLDYFTKEAQVFWYTFMGKYRKGWISCLQPEKIYYNTNMTRPYMDYKDKSLCANRFALLKQIWKDRDVILIEGEKSRLGVGNDLFATAHTVKRILAPARDAYSKYEEIKTVACKQDKNALYLLALGPTATILAYDLHHTGRQAIDVGHVDIEYEWFLRKAEKKVSIENKYVNEVDAGTNCKELLDVTYQSQIIANICNSSSVNNVFYRGKINDYKSMEMKNGGKLWRS